jgi:hypothetical protein
MPVEIEHQSERQGRPAGLCLRNDDTELLLPTGHGPRVMGYGPRGGPSVFAEISPERQGTDTPFGDRWHIYGGHRLWHAPEDAVRTYWPDNVPVHVVSDAAAGRITLTQVVEPHTKLEKSIEVTLAPRGSHVSVVHRLVNRGGFAVELAAWALSVMAPGGRAIFPQARFVPHPEALAPARPLVLWPFTRMSDPRWTWGDRFIGLRQDPGRSDPQKVGFRDDQGWMAYQLRDLLFVKRHRPLPGAHADHGCNVETFTNAEMLELETLSPMSVIPPAGTLVHREHWYLWSGVALGDSEAALAAALDPLLAETRMPES